MAEDSKRTDADGELQRSVDDFVRTAHPPPAEILELDFVYEALSHPRRRYLCYSLLSGTRWTLRELATKLVAWEQDCPEQDVAEYEIDDVYVSLYHVHLPKLVKLGIVEFEDGEDEEVVVAAENAVQVLAVLEGAGASLDALQEEHARSEYETE